MITEVLAQIKTTFPRIGPLQPPTTLEELVRYIFVVTIVILGLLIFWRLIRAGIAWMLAGEDIQKIQSAKSMIWNAFLGALIILASVIFLRTISPSYTTVSVPVEPPRKVPKHETIAKQKGVAFCKENCDRSDTECIENNCENFTGGSANTEKLIKEGYNYLIGYGDPGEGKKNFAIFFDKSGYEITQPLAQTKAVFWLEEHEREKQLDLNGMKTSLLGSYDTLEKNEIKITLCRRTDLKNEEDMQKFCTTFNNTEGKALKKENISSCKSKMGINVCDYVREIRIEYHGYVLLTQNENFNGYALFSPAPQTSLQVGGLVPVGEWGKQDMCVDKKTNLEVLCDLVKDVPHEHLPVYISVKSLLLIPK